MAVAAAPQGWVTVAIVVGVMAAYEELESRCLIPRIYGRTLRLPSSTDAAAIAVAISEEQIEEQSSRRKAG